MSRLYIGAAAILFKVAIRIAIAPPPRQSFDMRGEGDAMTASDRVRAERRLSLVSIALFAAIGAAIRLGWLKAVHYLDTPARAGEATNVAWSLARHGAFADAFFVGQGPTAHLLPTAPLISGALIRLCGDRPGAAGIVLAIWCLVQIGAAIGLAAVLFRRIGTAPTIVERALILVALIPIYIPEEMFDFQFWENGIAAALAAANLLMIAALDQKADWRHRDRLAIALLSALCFFVSPPAGLAIDCCWAVCILRRRRPGDAAITAALCALALAVLVTPWAMRNQATFGEPVLLRSDFGLELALGTDPGQAAASDKVARFVHRAKALHPYAGAPARHAMIAAGGELAYSRDLGSRTWQWIRRHPAAYGRIALRHYREFFLPAPWQFHFSEWKAWERSRAVLIDTVNAVGLIALVVGMLLGWRAYGYLLGYTLVAALPYALVQPIPRYTYIVFPVLAFAAVRFVSEGAAAIARLARRERDRRAAAPHGARAPRYRGSARQRR